MIKQKSVKGTFLCQFVASDGLIAICKSYNALKQLFLDLNKNPDFEVARLFTLANLVKVNQIIAPFYKLIKDN